MLKYNPKKVKQNQLNAIYKNNSKDIKIKEDYT